MLHLQKHAIETEERLVSVPDQAQALTPEAVLAREAVYRAIGEGLFRPSVAAQVNFPAWYSSELADLLQVLAVPSVSARNGVKQETIVAVIPVVCDYAREYSTNGGFVQPHCCMWECSHGSCVAFLDCMLASCTQHHSYWLCNPVTFHRHRCLDKISLQLGHLLSTVDHR